MRVYTSKLTPDSVVTYLFHDCERSPIVLLSVACACVCWSAMIKVQYTLNCLRVAVFCACLHSPRH